MNVLVLQGSPRKNGNTKKFSEPFMDELRKGGAQVTEVWLYDKEIRPCYACGGCQNAEGKFGCILWDDMHELFDLAMASDLLVLSTPIYAFFCTAPMKAFLDRFIYASGKYYGVKKLPSLTRGKKCAVLSTCGYPPKTAMPMFEEAVRSICKHIGMIYLGSSAALDSGSGQEFMTSGKAEQAREFARGLLCG